MKSNLRLHISCVICVNALMVAAQILAAQSTVLVSSRASTAYVLGPEDQISIRAVEAEEISEKPVRIDGAGNIRLPLVGRVHVAGITVEQLETDLAGRLGVYVQRPDVTVTITEFGSHPVSVLGFVRNPGVYQIHGQKSLVEVIALAGGLREDAGDRVKIQRSVRSGVVELPSQKTDAGAAPQPSAIEVSMSSLVGTSSSDSILVQADDVISVPKADMIYVLGDVHKAGGFVVRDGPPSVSVAIALAEGWLPTAAPAQAKVLRLTPDSTERTQLAVDIKKVIGGKAPDVPLEAGDILFVPNSTARSATRRSIEAAIQIGTGIAIFRP